MRKFLIKISMMMILPLALMGCTSNKKEEMDTDKLKITVSISPLKEFTEAIGGDKVEVTTLVPENTEPHDFDFKPKDLEKIIKEKLFIYNGLGMEEWLSNLEGQLSNSSVKLIDSSNGADILKDGEKIDPHLWLSLKQAQVQGNNIKNALVEVDPENKDYYEENYNKFKSELDNLYNEYEGKFNDVKTKYFVTSHAAFGYLCREFGLTQKSIRDIFGEGEERPQDKANLIQFCKDNNITTIFSESSDSQKSAESLASEINGKVEGIYTLETKPEGKTYLEAMKYNLDTIYNSMK